MHVADKLSGRHDKFSKVSREEIKNSVKNGHNDQRNSKEFYNINTNNDVDARRINKEIKNDGRSRQINKNMSDSFKKRGMDSPHYDKRNIGY